MMHRLLLARHALQAANEELSKFPRVALPPDPRTELLFNALTRLAQAVDALSQTDSIGLPLDEAGGQVEGRPGVELCPPGKPDLR
jgi:hypothetical protein